MPITEGGRFSPENRIVSPGVFTRENNLSGVAQGVADIGAVVVAPFAKGPGFSPTLISDSATLQNTFGVPDGTLYGPYTANEYLKEKGFVTVCRVGALTGYNQNHPLVIYAQQGRWKRANDSGCISGSSFIVPSGAYSTGNPWSSVVLTTQSNAVAGAGTLTFTNPSMEFTFGSVVGSASSATSQTGSTLFAGQAIQFTGGTYSFNIWYSGSSAPTLASILASGSMTGSLVNLSASLVGGNDPFDYVAGADPDGGPLFVTGSFIMSNNSGCSSPVFQFNAGLITGDYGKYTGQFANSSTLVYDNCGNLTGGNGVTKILAILADTQASNLDATLTSPGFSGSTLLTSSVLINNSSSIYQDYKLVLSSSLGSGWGSYEFSLNSGDNNYITNVFGTDPTAGNPATQVQGQKIEAAYIYSIFEDVINEVNANPDDWIVQVSAPVQLNSALSSSVAPLTFTDNYSLQPTKGDSAFSLTHAYTPWILSQAVAGVNGSSHRFELFKLHTLADGTNANTSYKIEISNVKLAGTVAGSDWGTFNLAVRAFSDTENRPVYLEQYQNLTLDPTSANFISRRLGDTYSYITAAGKIIEFGTFKNISKYIRVEVSENNYPVSAVPAGFEAYEVPFGGSVIDGFIPPMAYTKASTWSNSPGKYASGVVFGQTLSVDDELTCLYPSYLDGNLVYADNLQYFAPLPNNVTTGANTAFTLDADYSGSGYSSGSVHALPFGFGVGSSAFLEANANTFNAVPYNYNAANEATYVKMRKFVLGFQGGFDGQSPAIPINIGSDITSGNTQGLNCTKSTTAGSVAYNQCIGALSNADQFDINLLVMPGIFHSLHSYVAQLGIDLCEQRGDCFYIMDNVVFPHSNQSVDMIPAAINDVGTIDSNYVASYYPWIKILDTNINQIVSIPPSVIMPSIYAASDASSAEWFAPAGLNRGGISQAVGVLDKLTIADRDALYEGRVNPIASFPSQGIVVWGQKTLQVKHDATDRINVRRLLIALKKFIASTSKYIVFEQNDTPTRNRFLSVVNPYLESVQQRSGLYAFKVVMDGTNNTSDIIDNNILYGQIYLQPTKTAEYIVLDFNILPTGASFGS